MTRPTEARLNFWFVGAFYFDIQLLCHFSQPGRPLQAK
jgi:hypothetical protein